MKTIKFLQRQIKGSIFYTACLRMCLEGIFNCFSDLFHLFWLTCLQTLSRSSRSPSCVTSLVDLCARLNTGSCERAAVQWHHVEKCFHVNIVIKIQNERKPRAKFTLLTCWSSSKQSKTNQHVFPRLHCTMWAQRWNWYWSLHLTLGKTANKHFSQCCLRTECLWFGLSKKTK